MKARARNVVEKFLQAEKDSNKQKGILPSENIIIDRLLAHGQSMTDVYTHILKLERLQWQEFVRAILRIAAFWPPERIRSQRAARQELSKLNEKIAAAADHLEFLLRQRRQTAEHYDLFANDDGHPLDWIERAAEGAHLYQSWIKPELDQLRASFDTKYWPEPEDVVSAIADYARNSEISPTNLLTAEALSTRKSSIADFVRALLAGIEDLRDVRSTWLPADFHLTDMHLADIVNCALGLDIIHLVNADQIKKIRSRRKGTIRDPENR